MVAFKVTLGRLVRESASIVVLAKSKEDLEARLLSSDRPKTSRKSG